MRRTKLVLAIVTAIVVMVLVFASSTLALSPRGTIGEGRTDIKEGHNFIQRGKILGRPKEVRLGHYAIREGQRDIQQGRRQLRHRG